MEPRWPWLKPTRTSVVVDNRDDGASTDADKSFGRRVCGDGDRDSEERIGASFRVTRHQARLEIQRHSDRVCLGFCLGEFKDSFKYQVERRTALSIAGNDSGDRAHDKRSTADDIAG